jgi:hypothetical protein
VTRHAFTLAGFVAPDAERIAFSTPNEFPRSTRLGRKTADILQLIEKPDRPLADARGYNSVR